MPKEGTFCKPELLETTNSQKQPPKEICKNGYCRCFSIIFEKYLQASFC